MPEISVIVPVYNSEKYLHRCVDSILAQTFTDFELLLIDDGSKDRSASICDEYAAKDSRVRVFHKENGGPSSARNVGLHNANGDFIVFCDSDDWVESTMYEELYNKAKEKNADIVYFDMKMVLAHSSQTYTAARYSSNKNSFIKNYISSVWTVLWNFIAKKEIYKNNNLNFPTHLCYCEDFWLSVRLFHFANKIEYINKTYYNYNMMNESSIVHTLNKKTEKDEQTAYLETIEFFKQQGVFEEYEQELSWRILKSKQELVLDSSRHKEFFEIFPTSHKYIWSCPYINKKLKIMMWMLSNGMRPLLNLIIKTRRLLRR